MLGAITANAFVLIVRDVLDVDVPSILELCSIGQSQGSGVEGVAGVCASIGAAIVLTLSGTWVLPAVLARGFGDRRGTGSTSLARGSTSKTGCLDLQFLDSLFGVGCEMIEVRSGEVE